MINAITPLDYWIDVWAALARAYWYCFFRPGQRVQVSYRFIEHRNTDFFGGIEYVEKVKCIMAVKGGNGGVHVTRTFYRDK